MDREERLETGLRRAIAYLHQTTGAQGSGHIHMWPFEKCPHAECVAATAALAEPATADKAPPWENEAERWLRALSQTGKPIAVEFVEAIKNEAQMAIIKNRMVEGGKEFWDHVEQVAAATAEKADMTQGCRWCDEGNTPIQSSVSDKLVHHTSVGRVLCRKQPALPAPEPSDRQAGDTPEKAWDRCATEAIDVVREYIVAYPTTLFPEPPKGKHGTSIEQCYARALRVILLNVLRDIKERLRGHYEEPKP